MRMPAGAPHSLASRLNHHFPGVGCSERRSGEASSAAGITIALELASAGPSRPTDTSPCKVTRCEKLMEDYRCSRLRQNVPDHFPVHVGQPHIAAAETIGKFFVVHAQQVQHSGVEIIDFDLVLDREIAVFVSGPINGAALDAATRQPNGEAEGVVIAAIAALGHGGAA